MDVDPLAQRVALRFRDQRGPSKKHRVDQLWRYIRDATGLGRSMAEDIANAFIRGRDVERLAQQKRWPLENGILEGPTGQLALADL